MQCVGYARVSSIDQDWSIQTDALTAAGCTKLFTETKSGTSTNERTALDECLAYIREGDTLMVTRVDRLTRSILDLQTLLIKLREKKVTLKATQQSIDTDSASGKAFLDMLGVFAEFETNIRRERQLEGVARAKKEGKYKGRRPTALAKTSSVIQLTNQGLTRKAVAEQLNIGIASVFRILKQHKKDNPAPPPPPIQKKIMVENNSKFVRGKNESRRRIEDECFLPFDMIKKHEDRWEYKLAIPYETDEELDEIIYDMMDEANHLADLKNGYAEMSVVDPITEKSW